MSVIQPRSLGFAALIVLSVAVVFHPARLNADDDTSAKPARKTSVLGGLVRTLLGKAETEEAADPAPIYQAVDTEPSVDDSIATHKQAAVIKIAGKGNEQQLRTFCVNNAGTIYAVVGPDRPYSDVKSTERNNASEIRVLDSTGKQLDKWSLEFAAQSIAVAPNGTVVVAGNGRIAKFDPSGKLLLQADTPHLVNILKNPESLREEAEGNLEDSKEQYEAQLKQVQESVTPLKKELAELEKKDEADRTSSEIRRIRTVKASIKSMESLNTGNLQYYKQQTQRSVDDIVKDLTTRLKIINALAVTDQDVFIASGITRGYGYAIWRTNFDFEGGKQIVTGLSGCCGQMDIRCCDDGVYVAENSRKRVLHYDRDGKKLAQFGEGDRNGSTGAKFGGCCNPMNLCFGSGGELLTAESEGYIKRFTKEGSFLGIVGQAKVSGGCKNVAIGTSPDGDKVYFYDRQNSTIVILDKKSGNVKPASATEDAGS